MAARAINLLCSFQRIALEGHLAVLVHGSIGFDNDVGLRVAGGAVSGVHGELLDLDGGRVGAGNLFIAMDFNQEIMDDVVQEVVQDNMRLHGDPSVSKCGVVDGTDAGALPDDDDLQACLWAMHPQGRR